MNKEQLVLEHKREQSISVILPAYNEADRIFEVISEAIKVLEGMAIEYEVIVVDDGSTDSTSSEVLRASSTFNHVRYVFLPENQGKGNALRHGFQASTYELVCFIDADLDLHPSQVERLVADMEKTGAEIVIGSKRHPESKLDYPWFRKLYSNWYYYLILLLFRLPVRDTQTGIKLFRREVLEKVFPRMVCKQYTLDLELLAVAHRMGFTITESPIDLTFQGKFGRIKWADIRNIFVDTFAVFYRLFFLRYYDSPLKPVVKYEPRMSIIIPTRELDPMARECIRKCHDIDYRNYDIKFIPDEPVDVELEPPGSSVLPSGPIGPSIKRNIGVRDSDADIIAFIDADAWPDSDWLKNAVPYFEDEAVAAVGGPALTAPGDTRRQVVSGLVYASSLVSGNTAYRYLHHALREVDDYPSVNLLIRRSDFEKAGGYPEEFWPGEDTVLCNKLTHDLGKKIIYVPNVVVNHHRRAVYRAHLKQVGSYARHRGFFVRKFPENSRHIQYFVPSVFVLFLVAGLGPAIAFRPVLYAYLSVVGFYLLLCLASSIKSLEPLLNVMVFPGIISTNIAYGIGFLRGLLARKMSEQ
jgi:glycosyltransferase involved in cell wall biosynthesis